MKGLYLCLFSIIFVAVINGQGLGRNDIVTISSGTSFGFCISYCRRSIFIRSEHDTLVARKEPNFPQDEYPPVEKRYRFTANEWTTLISVVNPRAFRASANTIGCPDCADGGAEWIEIKWPTVTKRVTFEFGKKIEGSEELVLALRKLRKQTVETL